MALFGWITGTRRDLDIAGLARELATTCYASVERHLARRSGTLTSLHEAHGYVRVWAAAEIESYCSRRTVDRTVSRQQQQQISERAIKLLVTQLAPELLGHAALVTDRRRAA